jgi:hypothetical protein
MSDIKDALRRLASDFAEQIIDAVRRASLDELAALKPTIDTELAAPPPSREGRRTRAKSPPQRPKSSKRERVQLDAATIKAAERFFAERGDRGATEGQVYEALSAQGLPLVVGASELVQDLVGREVLRYAGFRRTTGRGSAPVYVLA